MVIDEIRSKLADILYLHESWVNVLDDTNPGHYGINNWDVKFDIEDIWIDIPTKTFTLKNAQFEFNLVLGGSSDVTNMGFNKVAKGKGKFTLSKDKVTVDEFEIEVDLDLMG